jgi:hypothetical protein
MLAMPVDVDDLEKEWFFLLGNESRQSTLIAKAPDIPQEVGPQTGEVERRVATLYRTAGGSGGAADAVFVVEGDLTAEAARHVLTAFVLPNVSYDPGTCIDVYRGGRAGRFETVEEGGVEELTYPDVPKYQ